MEKQTEEKAIEQAVKKCPYKRICKIINGCKCKEIVENKIQDLSISYLADNQAQFLREELEKILQEINDALHESKDDNNVLDEVNHGN